MDSLADIRAVLAAAGQRIERGALREDRACHGRTVATGVRPCADDLQPYVWARLSDFSAQLGVRGDVTADRSPVRAPPEVFVRR